MSATRTCNWHGKSQAATRKGLKNNLTMCLLWTDAVLYIGHSVCFKLSLIKLDLFDTKYTFVCLSRLSLSGSWCFIVTLSGFVFFSTYPFRDLVI